MPGGRLRPLQERILRTLAPLTPPWTLTGGGALAGFYLGHRETRDLDLFWRRRKELGDLTRDAVAALQAEGLVAEALRSAPAFAELRVGDGTEVCIVDLVAEPFAPIEPPERAEVQGASIEVDTRHEILVNKLTTLLSRSELRDLQDVKALLDAGGDLERALADAPTKDAGFSALTLAWVLRSFEPRSLARAVGWSDADIDQLVSFQQWLLERLTSGSVPE